jgi:hypothetical protein
MRARANNILRWFLLGDSGVTISRHMPEALIRREKMSRIIFQRTVKALRHKKQRVSEGLSSI